MQTSSHEPMASQVGATHNRHQIREGPLHGLQKITNNKDLRFARGCLMGPEERDFIASQPCRGGVRRNPPFMVLISTSAPSQME